MCTETSTKHGRCADQEPDFGAVQGSACPRGVLPIGAIC